MFTKKDSDLFNLIAFVFIIRSQFYDLIFRIVESDWIVVLRHLHVETFISHLRWNRPAARTVVETHGLIHVHKVLKDRSRLKSPYVVCTEEAADATVDCGRSHRTSDDNQHDAQCRNDPSKEAQWTVSGIVLTAVHLDALESPAVSLSLSNTNTPNKHKQDDANKQSTET